MSKLGNYDAIRLQQSSDNIFGVCYVSLSSTEPKRQFNEKHMIFTTKLLASQFLAHAAREIKHSAIKAFTMSFLLFIASTEFFPQSLSQSEYLFFFFSPVIIITSPLNAPETLAILNHLQNFNHSKILIVDITGAVLNHQNEFYRNLNRYQTKWHSNNLFVLTILSEKFKRFLNKTFTSEYKKMYDESTLRLYDSFTTTTSQLHAISEGATTHMMPPPAPTTKLPRTLGNAIIDWIKENTGIVGDGTGVGRRQRRLTRLIASHESTADDDDVSDAAAEHGVNGEHWPVATKVFLNEFCGDSCASVISSTSNCEKHFATVLSELKRKELIALCEYLVNQWRMDMATDNRRQKRRRWANTASSTKAPDSVAMNQSDETAFGANFGLFDFLATSLAAELGNSGRNATQNATGLYDFIMLDFRLDINDLNETSFVWRPLLILQQNQLNQHLFYTHPLLPGYHHWLLDNSTRFWKCGLICWILAGIVCLLLICIVMASVTVVIAIRYVDPFHNSLSF